MEYKIFDTHCDTISLINENSPLRQNSLHFDLARAKKYQAYVQVFALFTDPDYAPNYKENCIRLYNSLKKEAEKNSDIFSLCTTYKDISSTFENNKIAGIIAVEGGDMVNSIEDIDMLYSLGVRILTLTWNYTNKIASGIMDADADYGLTSFGRVVVKRMNELNMIIDVSHSSEKTFWDVAHTTSKPIIASHSNSRKIAPHKRNLTDEQIKAIIQLDGIIGLNFCPLFLRYDGVNINTIATIDDILKHTEHFLNLGCENVLGLGSDFDGVTELPQKLIGVENIKNLIDAFAMNFGENIAKKFAFVNFNEFFKKSLL